MQIVPVSCVALCPLECTLIRGDFCASRYDVHEQMRVVGIWEVGRFPGRIRVGSTALRITCGTCIPPHFIRLWQQRGSSWNDVWIAGVKLLTTNAVPPASAGSQRFVHYGVWLSISWCQRPREN